MAIRCRAMDEVHSHETVSEVRDCYDWKYYVESGAAEADARAECAAEMANERWFEDRGWAEALAEREWEDARGVIQFEDAMALAEEAARRA